MLIKSVSRNEFSFGKLSDKGVIANSPLSKANQEMADFSSANFQYIVDHIVDMYGYAHGTIKVGVEANDVKPVWQDLNRNGKIDKGELTLHFTMNAWMNSYDRTSVYGKHFMYQMAKQYGQAVIWGIAAHEVGHLVAHNALNILETRIVQGRPALVCTMTLHSYWDELCADYLAGVTMAKASPPIDCEPLKKSLEASPPGSEHPGGFWRCRAIEWGYQWGKNNPAQATAAVMADINAQKQLLQSFFLAYYQNLYARVPRTAYSQYGALPNVMMQPANILLGYL